MGSMLPEPCIWVHLQPCYPVSSTHISTPSSPRNMSSLRRSHVTEHCQSLESCHHLVWMSSTERLVLIIFVSGGGQALRLEFNDSITRALKRLVLATQIDHEMKTVIVENGTMIPFTKPCQSNDTYDPTKAMLDNTQLIRTVLQLAPNASSAPISSHTLLPPLDHSTHPSSFLHHLFHPRVAPTSYPRFGYLHPFPPAPTWYFSPKLPAIGEYCGVVHGEFMLGGLCPFGTLLM